jgi:C1A family cysteine protease
MAKTKKKIVLGAKKSTKKNPPKIKPVPEVAAKLRYGWVPDLPDQRDIMYSSVTPVREALPSKADLRPLCSPVEDQGQLGSCTGNALVGALEFLEKKNKIKKFEDLSRLFVYYNERVIENTIFSDAGAMIRDGIKSLKKLGVCSEKKWPYAVKKFAVKPSPACYRDALNHQITAYQRISTLDQMRACLADGYPVVFGFTVYEGFESEIVAQTGVLQMPTFEERVIGGHAVLAVGYDDTAQRLIVRNSWGTNWGMQGYFTMPYGYIKNRNLSDDFWTIRQAENL